MMKLKASILRSQNLILRRRVPPHVLASRGRSDHKGANQTKLERRYTLSDCHLCFCSGLWRRPVGQVHPHILWAPRPAGLLT